MRSFFINIALWSSLFCVFGVERYSAVQLNCGLRNVWLECVDGVISRSISEAHIEAIVEHSKS